MKNIKVINHQKTAHIYYSRNGKVIRISTGVKWVDRNSKQDIIASFEEKVSNIITSYIKEYQQKPSVEYVRNKLKEKEIKIGSLFLDNYKDFLEEKRTSIKPQSLKDYISLENALIEYQIINKIKLTFDSINISFLGEFVNFLVSTERPKNSKTKGGLNDKTISKRMSSLKSYMKWIEENKIFTFDEKTKKHRIVSQYDTDIVHLSLDELKQLKELKLSNTYEKVRDVFIFMSMTSLRYSDILTLKKEHIDSNYRLEKKPQKARNRERYSQTLNSTAIEVWEKYGHQLPKISNQKFNVYLKELLEESELFDKEIKKVVMVKGKEVVTKHPKWELISSHTARRSFITNHIEAGTPINKIMEMTSHKKLDTLVKYINKFGSDKATSEQIAL